MGGGSADFGVGQSVVDRITAVLGGLTAERDRRLARNREVKSKIEALWDRLDVGSDEQDAFLRLWPGMGLDVYAAYQAELARLESLKLAQCEALTHKARQSIAALWEGLYMGEDERHEFAPYFMAEFTEASLVAHDNEIARLEGLKTAAKGLLPRIARREAALELRAEQIKKEAVR